MGSVIIKKFARKVNSNHTSPLTGETHPDFLMEGKNLQSHPNSRTLS
jgi:hypothetical protein